MPERSSIRIPVGSVVGAVPAPAMPGFTRPSSPRCGRRPTAGRQHPKYLQQTLDARLNIEHRYIVSMSSFSEHAKEVSRDIWFAPDGGTTNIRSTSSKQPESRG
jgi:hypothetical protein